MIIHYIQLHNRQFIVPLVVADLPSLSTFSDFYACTIEEGATMIMHIDC